MKTRKTLILITLIIVFIGLPIYSLRPFFSFHSGKILEATQNIGDPRFEGAVLYIADHNITGARGFVLNKTDDHNMNWSGPVSPDMLFIAKLNEKTKTPFLTFKQTDLNVDDHNVRYYKGYSGWGKMQLNFEIFKKCWTVRDFDVGYVRDLITPHMYTENIQ